MNHESYQALIVAIGAEAPEWTPETLEDVAAAIYGDLPEITFGSIQNTLAGILRPEQLRELEKSARAYRRNHPKSGTAKKHRAPIVPITAAKLKEKEIPPVRWIVEDLLPVGLAMIAAPPKYYKSYMALDLSVAVAVGQDFLGFQAHKHKVLYLDLESTERRPKTRLTQIIGADKAWPEDLQIVTAEHLDAVGRIGDGFEDQLTDVLVADPEIRLVIVDVFQRIRPPDTGRKGVYDRDYDDYEVLKRLADDRGIALLLIHHMRKQQDTDEFNQISGSAGTLGALDTAWAITKENGDRDNDEATLSITGRDVLPQKYRIKWNKDRCMWELMGTEEQVADREAWKEYDRNPIVRTVRALLDQNGGTWQGTSTEIQRASYYFNGGEDQIFDDPAIIGKYLRQHTQDFRKNDGIAVKDHRENRRRLYLISYLSEASLPSSSSQMSLPL